MALGCEAWSQGQPGRLQTRKGLRRLPVPGCLLLDIGGCAQQLAPQGRGVKCAARSLAGAWGHLAKPFPPDLRDLRLVIQEQWRGFRLEMPRCKAWLCATLKPVGASVSSCLDWGGRSAPCRVVKGSANPSGEKLEPRARRKHELRSYIFSDVDPGFLLECSPVPQIFTGRSGDKDSEKRGGARGDPRRPPTPGNPVAASGPGKCTSP